MRQLPRTLIAAIAGATLVVAAGCSPAEEAAAPTPPAATTQATPTAEDAAVSTTEAAPTSEEPAGTAPTSEGPTGDGETTATAGPSTESTDGRDDGDDGEGSGEDADVAAPEGLPTMIVEEEVAWSSTGRFVGTVGDTAGFVQEGSDGGSVLVGITADGTRQWQVPLERPEQIGAGQQAEPFVMRGLDGFIVGWAGPLADGPEGSAGVHASVLEPATGQERALGFTELEGARTVPEAASLDELFVQTEGGAAIVRVDTDTGELTPRASDDPVWGDQPVIPVTSTLGVLVDGRDYTLQLVDDELEPVGDVAQCAWPQGPGQPYLHTVSANGTYAAAPGGVVNLETGEIACLSTNHDMYVEALALVDDGATLGASTTEDGPVGMVLKVGEMVRVDEDGTAVAVGILGDVVVFEAEGGWTAHRLRAQG